MSSDRDSGWEEYKRLVMSSLLRLERMQERHDQSDERRFDEIGETLAAIRQDIAGLKVKAGIWGFAAGSIPASVAILYLLVEKLI